MLLLLLAAYIAVAVCVWVVLNRRWRRSSGFSPISHRLMAISLAVAWPVHLWSWFSEFRKELF